MTKVLLVAVVASVLAASSVLATDRIVGVVSSEGGAILVKHFTVSAGTTISGIAFVSNDLRTVFPKVALLRGPAAKLSGAETLLEFPDVGARESHRITITFSPLHLELATELYVAVTTPPSDGTVSHGEGVGLPATQLETPSGCYFASGVDADLGPMDVDYAVDLVFGQQAGKANAGTVEPEQVRPTTFLRAGVPNPTSGSMLVTFGLERAGATQLAVYDVAGRQLRMLAQETLGAGMHVRDWDGRDSRGRRVAAGIYLVRLTAAERVLTQKLVVMR